MCCSKSSPSREDHSIAGASVCIWERAEPGQPSTDVEDISSPKHQQQIFTATVQQLLGKARLKSAPPPMKTINLATMNEAERKATLDLFRKFDCVVAVGDLTDAEIAHTDRGRRPRRRCTPDGRPTQRRSASRRADR